MDAGAFGSRIGAMTFYAFILIIYLLLFFVLFDQELNANRPPTPTRGRPQVASDRGSLAWI
jgi:hypothetical protein